MRKKLLPTVALLTALLASACPAMAISETTVESNGEPEVQTEQVMAEAAPKAMNDVTVEAIGDPITETDSSTQKNLKLSQEGVAFIKGFETFSSRAVQIGTHWYIGYGTSCTKDTYPNGITEQKATELLNEALQSPIERVNQFLGKYKLTVTQPQFDALVSFTYSLSSDWMKPEYRFCSYLLGGLDKQKDVDVIDTMALWCHVGKKVEPKILERRIREGRLLLYGDYGANGSRDFSYLILDGNGGSIEKDTVCYEKGVPYGKLPAATRTSYALDGWYTASGEKLTADAVVSKGMSVTAKWIYGKYLSFSDMHPNDWFYSYVYDLYVGGVVNGYQDNTFGPSKTVTYGEALKLILMAADYPQQAPTGKHWASGYLTLAVNKKFIPTALINLDDIINREEIAQIAARTLKLSPSVNPSPFNDTTDGLTVALHDVKILEGMEENGKVLFKPDKSITRAEISAVIWRMSRYEAPALPKPPTDPPVTPSKPNVDHSNQFLYKDKWLDILQGVPVSTYNAKKFAKDSRGFMKYNSDEYVCQIGVDVSAYQGDIDWKKVKAAGVEYAIIRVGGRGYGSTGAIYADTKFEANMKGAMDAGLKVGVYFFSQAITVQEAREEAEYVVSKIKKYNVTYPVVFDWESIGGNSARTDGISSKTLGACAKTFCETIEKAGYHPMVYFNCNDGYFHYDLRDVAKYDFWFAGYTSTPVFYYHFDMWQYTSSGSIPGIPSKADVNLYLLKVSV